MDSENVRDFKKISTYSKNVRKFEKKCSQFFKKIMHSKMFMKLNKILPIQKNVHELKLS